jgi:preprotein translocase SecE subunit
MAVAEKPTSKTSTRTPTQQLALASLAGAGYLVASLAIVLSGIPTLWEYWLGIDDLINSWYPRPGEGAFLSTALVILASVAAAFGLVVLGRKLEGPHPLRGLKAGSVIGAILFLAIFVILFHYIGNSLAARQVEAVVAWTVMIGVGALLLFGVYWLYNRPAFAKWLINLEENGWFSATSFKYNQGQKVRRATLIALLVLVGYGIFINVQTRMFGTGDWEVLLPGVDAALVVLFNLEYTMPLLVFAVLGWFCWRLVNWPTFADFLIATEAEMNKVSWTTRKRLFQDTIVVLVTVVLLTTFLFVVDVIFIWALGTPLHSLNIDIDFPGVLQVNPFEARQKQMAPTDW